MAVLRDHLGISSLDVILRCGRLRWFGHISRMEENNWQKQIMSFEVEGVQPQQLGKEDIKTVK